MEERPLPSLDEQFNAAVEDYHEGRLTLDGLRALYSSMFCKKEEDPPSQSGPSAS